MNFRDIWTVFKKEVKDLARDKKVVITSLLLPMLLIPLVNILVGGGAEKLQKDINDNLIIAISKESNSPELKSIVQNEIFKDSKNIKIVEVEDSIDAVRKEAVRVVLDFEKGYAEKLNAGKPFVIKIIYDKSKVKSEASLAMVNKAIEEFNKKTAQNRVASIGVDPEILQPAKIEENNVADAKQSGNSTLIMVIPLITVMFIATGGIPVATDLVAGEKERNTLEPLLTTKPSRASLLIGKYLTVTLFSFVSVTAILIGYFVGYAINPNSLAMASEQQASSFYIEPLALFLVVLIFVTLGMTFAGIQITLSTYAKSFKEAQTYMSFLMIFAIAPAYATMFMQPNEIPLYMFFVPLLNSISALKVALGGVVNYYYLWLALGTSIVYVILTLSLASSMFKKEKVLFRS